MRIEDLCVFGDLATEQAEQSKRSRIDLSEQADSVQILGVRCPPFPRIVGKPLWSFWQLAERLRFISIQFALDVVAGEKVTGLFIRQACQRHLSDLERDDIYFDQHAATVAIQYSRLWKHWKGGQFAGKPFILADWQEFVVGSLFGWKRRDTNRRRFRFAHVEIPRKNGKTFLAGHIAILLFRLDKEPGAEVYAIATKSEQAKLVWKDAWHMISSSISDKLRNSISLPKNPNGQSNTIADVSTSSILKPLCSKYSTLDGLNPSGAILDEMHEWRDEGLWEVIKQAFGAREQPLVFAITTAGYNKHGICYKNRKHSLNILDPEQPDFVDDSWFAFIATVDPADLDHPDPQHLFKSETAWKRANPSLGISKSLEYMRSEAHQALLKPSERNGFLNKQLNIWTSAHSTWINMSNWHSAKQTYAEKDLHGKRCFGGMDLARVNDLSAFVLFFPPAAAGSPGKILSYFWCPEDDIDQRQKNDHVPYQRWSEKGWIRTTPGNKTDFSFIERDILTLAEKFDIVDIGFDPVFAGELENQLISNGLDLVQFRQGFISMSPAVNEIERLILGGELHHDGNPIMTWMMENAVVSLDAAGNKKFDKRKAEEKIDGCPALAMSIGRHLAVDETYVSTARIEAW